MSPAEPTTRNGRSSTVQAALAACAFGLVIVIAFVMPFFGYDPLGVAFEHFIERYPFVTGFAILAALVWYSWFQWKRYRDTANPVSFSWLAAIVIGALALVVFSIAIWYA